MRKTLLILAATASLAGALGGCATAPTVFQPATGPATVGFSDLRVERDRFRVSFQGGPGAPPAQVEDYALLRAADIGLHEGFDWFMVVDRRMEQTGGSGSSLSIGTGGANFGRHSAVGVGLGTTIPLGGGPALRASLEVKYGSGPKPAGRDVYDVREVRASVGPRA